MAGSLQRLIQHTGLYAVGNALLKASGLLLAPLYLNTARLSQASFGHLDLLVATAQIAELVATMGLGMALVRYLTDPTRADDRRDVPPTALALMGVLAALTAALFVFGAPVLSPWLIAPEAPLAAFQWMGLATAARVVGVVPFTLLRTDERVGWYIVAKLFEMLLLLGGVYYALVVAEAGLVGVAYAHAASAVGSTLLLMLGIIPQLRGRLRPRLAAALVAYGAPLIIAGLAGRVLNLGDRYVLNAFTTAETVAVYGWAARLGGVINMLIVQSLQLAFSVLGLKAIGEGDVSLHRRAFRHYAVWGGWAVLGLTLLSYDVTRLVGDDVYLAADPLVLPIALGFYAFGINVLVNNVLYATSRTRALSLNVVYAAAFNIGLNLVLVPWLGAMGAAVATFAAYLLLAGLMAWQARATIHIHYPWQAFVLATAVVVALVLGAAPTVDWSTGARLLARAGLILLYWPLVVLLGLYPWGALRAAWEQLRARRPRP